MRILFDSKKLTFKDPFGTLIPGQDCKLNIHVPQTVGAVKVDCVLHMDGSHDEQIVTMLPTQHIGAYTVFSGSFSLANTGLYFYYFRVHKADSCFRLFKHGDDTNMEDGAQRNEIYDGIATTVDALAKEKNYGISVEDVKIKRFDLPESNLNAVYSRMISERNQMAEKFAADGNYEASIIRNEVDKQVNIIVSDAEAKAAELEAEGESEYMRLLAEAYNSKDKREFYEFTLALEALESSLTGDNKTVILDRDSDLAKILMGADK